MTNKEEYEKKPEVKARLAEQQSIHRERIFMHYNFRLWLVESFVRINRWDLVEDVVGRIYSWKLDLTLHRPLLRSMLEAIDWLIEPLYHATIKGSKFLSTYTKQINSSNFYPAKADHQSFGVQLKQANSGKTLFEELPKVLKIVTVNIAFDQKVFQKLTLVVKRECQKDYQDIA